MSFKLVRPFCVLLIFRLLLSLRGRRVIGISGSMIWSKTLMELLFNPYGEFRWSPEGPIDQINSPHLHVGALGIFSDLLRSVQMLKRVRCWKQWESTAPIQSLVKLQPWFLSLLWKTCLWAELQPRFLCMQWRTCPWAVHSDDDDDDDEYLMLSSEVFNYLHD